MLAPNARGQSKIQVRHHKWFYEKDVSFKILIGG